MPMLRTMLKSKIHRATVTQADLHYVGSVTIDEDLLDAADLLPGEQVAIVDVTNGARLETYVIPGERGSGVIGINGAAAHLVDRGDLVIVISYAAMDDEHASSYRPKVVFVDEANRPVELGSDPSTAPAGTGLTSGSQPGGSQPGGSQPGRPQAGGPQPGGPQAGGPQAGGPQASGSQPGGSQASGPQAAETDDAARLDALIQAEA